jgi:hypothetical protein
MISPPAKQRNDGDRRMCRPLAGGPGRFVVVVFPRDMLAGKGGSRMGGRFREFLVSGGVMVFDGGLGTTLFSRGVFINRCFDQLNLEQPGLVADRVQGIQVAAPFGRYRASIAVLEAARERRGAGA